MSHHCKINNYKLRNTLCLPIQHHLDKNLESSDEYECAIQQQQGSIADNRTFIISDPQHCSVSATLSLGRPKKLFISKGKITEKSVAEATFQASATTITSNEQNLNNPKEISIFPPTKIDQKSPVANFETKAISPSGNHHFRDSIKTNNNNILSQQRSKIIPFYPTSNENVATDSVAKYPDTNDTSEIIIDVPHPDSPHSTLNSHGSGGYRGDCSSVNSLHSMTEYKDGINRRQNNINEFRESLSSRLSRGFLEFTQGSSDRLQKWKNKLQNGRRHKDSSEPPPINRKMLIAGQEQNGHLSDVDVVLDWAIPKCDSSDQIHKPKFLSMGSAFTLKVNQPNMLPPLRSASDFFPISENTTKFVFSIESYHGISNL